MWISRVRWLAVLLLLGTGAQLTAAPPQPPAEQGGGQAPADAPLAKVEELVLEGRHREAQASAREAQHLYRRRGDWHGEAIGLLLLGLAEAGAGNLTAAAADLERSAETLASLGDGFGSWAALLARGRLARRQSPPQGLQPGLLRACPGRAHGSPGGAGGAAS